MKIILPVLAAAVAAVSLVPAPAMARHNGWNGHNRHSVVRCHSTWRHHHKVRVCRRVWR